MFEARKGKIYCPVFLTFKYFKRLGYRPTSNGYFLPKVVNKKLGRVRGKSIFVQVPSPKEHISYNTCLQDRRRLLEKIDLPAKEFTEHSDRSGGISHIFNNGASVKDAQVHSMWKSTETPKRYIQKDESKKRELSRFFFKRD